MTASEQVLQAHSKAEKRRESYKRDMEMGQKLRADAVCCGSDVMMHLFLLK